MLKVFKLILSVYAVDAIIGISCLSFLVHDQLLLRNSFCSTATRSHEYRSTWKSMRKKSTRQFSSVTNVDYPTKTRTVVSKLTQSIQKVLQARKSRIDIELPPGVDYGVESTSSKGELNSGHDNSEEVSIAKIQKSNREAARLITEMFVILASTTVVLFPTEAEASTARSIWGSKFGGQVLSLNAPSKQKGYGSLRSRRFSAEEQQQALLSDADGIYVPEETEVLIIAGMRGPKDFRTIQKIHEKFGEGTLIILLNTKIRGLSESWDDTLITSSNTNSATGNSGSYATVTETAQTVNTVAPDMEEDAASAELAALTDKDDESIAHSNVISVKATSYNPITDKRGSAPKPNKNAKPKASKKEKKDKKSEKYKLNELSISSGENCEAIARNNDIYKELISESGGESASRREWVDRVFLNAFNYAPPYTIPRSYSTSTATDGDKKQQLRDLLLYHEYGSKWFLAEKKSTNGAANEEDGGILGKVGAVLAAATSGGGFQTLWEGETYPSSKDMKNTLQ